jgi:superoxide dismutase, Cu-Zn family
MNTKYSLIALVATSSLLAFGCDKTKDSYEPGIGQRNDEHRVAATTSTLFPAGTAVGASHHSEHPPQPAATLAAPALSAASTASHTDGAKPDSREAEAKFQSVPTMKIEGDAELEEIAGGVRIEIEVKNALAGQKGIHIHQTDDCSDIANKSMGEHFAPTTPTHGLPNATLHHLGDLGNITIDKDGNGKLEITVMGANLAPSDPLTFIGKSIVIHESSDKGTGKSGDAGKPIACAPIRVD